MDIITHTLSGIAISTIVASLSKKEIWEKGGIVLCGGIGGILPDIDAMSLWSRFDSTVGTFFHLSHKGRDIYFSNYWYSHHNFFHSLVGGLIIISFLLALFSLPVIVCSKNNKIKSVFKQIEVYWIALFLGYMMHLLGDLPTPSCSWGGINLFWPLPKAIGGTGHIWWWNNYDIFLIIGGCCAINMVMTVVYNLLKKPFIRYLPLFICLVSFISVLHQIEQRNECFAYTGYTKRYDDYERNSLEIQQKILGNKLYSIMRNVDRKLRINF